MRIEKKIQNILNGPDNKNVWTYILPCKVKNKIENMKFSLTMSNLSYQIKTSYIPEIENRFFKIHNSTDIIIQHLCVNSGILYNPQYIYWDSKFIAFLFFSKRYFR